MGMETNPLPTVSSGFARLLATENIHVRVCSKAKTAMFNTDSRELTMPAWQGMSEQLVDMLLGHEVSHALHTTEPDIAATLKSLSETFKVPENICMATLNIVEDVRIDKLIQRRYPGLRRDYAAGYPEMREMNLFEVKDGEDLNDRCFLDRLNLHAKAYNGEIAFSPEEQELVDRAENTETYEDVMALVEDVLALVKKQHEENQPPVGTPEAGEGEGDMPMPTSEQGEDDGEDDGDTGLPGETTESGDEPGEDGEGGQESGDDDTTAEDGEGGESQGGEDSGESMEDDTDDGESAEGEQKTADSDGDQVGQSDGWQEMAPQSLEAMESNLADAAGNDDDYWRGNRVATSMMPKGLGEEAVVSIDETRKIFWNAHQKGEIRDTAYAGSEDVLASLRPTVNAMATAFERKQAAHIDQRTQIGKSGRLDMNKLHSYKLTEDLFLKTEIQPNGKNHAFTIVIDWSGSMSGKCESTIRQASMLAMFCKKVNVPCEVYIFQSHGGCDEGAIFDGGDVYGHVRLVKILDTASRNNLFNVDLKNAYVLGKTADDYSTGYIRDLCMGGTPLGASLTIAKFTHQALMAKNKAEVGNIIFLTDGEGSDDLTNRGSEETIVVDSASHRSYAAAGGQAAICEWIRGETGSKVINFFMCGKREGQNQIEYRTPYAELDDAKKRWRGEGWGYLPVNKREGWDAAFLVFDNAAKETEDAMEGLDENASKAKIRNAYVKSLKNRAACRPLVEKITDLIAA
tara:strand:- start:1683 stop:3911 length:2229 start_codon:yes stop_codon:yes gene_type:complete